MCLTQHFHAEVIQWKAPVDSLTKMFQKLISDYSQDDTRKVQAVVDSIQQRYTRLTSEYASSIIFTIKFACIFVNLGQAKSRSPGWKCFVFNNRQSFVCCARVLLSIDYFTTFYF